MRIFTLAVFLSMFTLVSSVEAGESLGQDCDIKVDDPLYKVLTLHRTLLSRGIPEFAAIIKDETVVKAMKTRWMTLKAAHNRIRILEALAAMGVRGSKNATSRRDHGWLQDRGVVDILIDALDDGSRYVRKEAVRLLRSCPDDMIRSRGADVVSHIEKRGNVEAIILLGRTLCAEARELLLRDDRFRKYSEHSRDLALAKLGDSRIEKKFIEEFLAEKVARNKAKLAWNLGYIATPGAVAALASELRTPMIEGHHPMSGQVSLRVIIIESLSRALPENELFWKPIVGPSSDAYYEKIERWAEQVMRIRWVRERPPFFYCLDAVTPEE